MKYYQKLLQYLYPTDEVRAFLVNDLYQELFKVVKVKTLYCEDNLDDILRSINYLNLKIEIEKFLKNHEEYKKELDRLLRHDGKTIVEDLIIGLLLYYSTSSYFKQFDIFKDRKSVLYSPASIIDVL